MYIYKITNVVNNKFYIGQTSRDNLSERWKEHLDAAHQWKLEEDLNQKHKFKSKLYSAMCKYGVENFTISPLKQCTTLEELNYYEDYFVEYLNARDDSVGYNISKGGRGHKSEPWNKGLKNAQKMTLAILETLERGRHLPASEKQKKQLRDRRTGIEVTQETREKLRASCSGYKWMINPNADNPKPEQIKESQVQEYLDMGYQFGMKLKN